VTPVRFDLAVPGDIRFGPGRSAELPRILTGLGVTRALVVTGARPERAALSAAGVGTEVFPVAGEPTVEVVRAGVAAATAAGCDGVLGFGGGSALDTAKAVAGLAASGTDPLDHLEVVGAGRPFPGPALPCVAVPTTAGTGSEVTRNAVLTAGPVKASLRSPWLLPRVAVVDPDLLIGVPRETIAATGMDALSQLIEPFLSARANPVTDALAREGIRCSARSLLPAWQGAMATDGGVRSDLALAGLLGGVCLANAGLGAVHGFAAAAGARLAAPHGAVCAALLPAALDVNRRALTARAPDHPALPRIAELGHLLTGRTGATADDAIAWLADLTAAMEVPGLGHYGATGADVPGLVEAAREVSSMRANPIALDDPELAQILTRSL
jgi:alcohol dehydrogenase class IV